MTDFEVIGIPAFRRWAMTFSAHGYMG
jgi:hypothetical protein